MCWLVTCAGEHGQAPKTRAVGESRGHVPLARPNRVAGPVQSASMSEPPDLATLLRERADRFERFAAWETSHPSQLTPRAAVAAVGALYELLPPESRRRPIDTSGIAR